MAAAVVAAAASVCATAQVLTAPLSASPTVRLTDSCSIVENDGVVVFGDAAGLFKLVNAVNNPSPDPAFLGELWWPSSARVTGFQGNSAVLVYGLFQDTVQIASALKADPGLFSWGVRDAGSDNFVCFATPPPPELRTVTEYENPRFGEYRLAFGGDESASLAADGWTATGDTYRVLASGTCYGGSIVFRFARAQADWRSGRRLVTDPAECARVRVSDTAWRPYDTPFAAVPPVSGACTGQYSGVAVYGLQMSRGPLAATSFRYTSSTATYAAMMAQGWTGSGIAFCAMP